jgi:undecaprenyl-diphosphatase
LAMPTMVGAFAYDIFKSRDLLTMNDAGLIAVGFIAAFISALVVVRALLEFVSKNGYAVFGWWRIIVGTLGLAALYTVG